ncbi:MAG: glycoside hydrolase family 16 protein, partial [Clostridia bacterium]|nr:glycoside hydrolase family 16 protein [Clostridia bacterium]
MKNWKLVFEDDFNEPKLNEAVWHKDTGFIRNREPQYYTTEDRNCFIEDGCLVIQTLREEYKGAHFTSAEITTERSHAWTYGRFEMRAKLPRSRAVWPAFWTLGANIHEV